MQVWIRQTSGYHCPGDEEARRFPIPGWMWDREVGRTLYRDRMRHIRHADELGFDGIIFTELHSVNLTPSPNLLVAAASQNTEQIKLVLMGNCLPLHGHPVRLAEELSMLDNLSDGRLVAGFVRGNASAHYAMNVSAKESRSRFEEAYDLILRAWTDENPFEWHGQHYDYDCVAIVPRPLQAPHPPVWTVAGSAEGLEWAARNHVGLVVQGTIPQANEIFDYYQGYAEQQCGWQPSAGSRAVYRDLYLAPTMAEIRRDYQDTILPLYLASNEHETHNQAIPKIAELRREQYTERSYAYQAVRKASLDQR
ncbi:MAG: monooxygenase, partial [Chloroflexi bacterium]|nr:monooxygenase [Chloroflexota bacterium]